MADDASEACEASSTPARPASSSGSRFRGSWVQTEKLMYFNLASYVLQYETTRRVREHVSDFKDHDVFFVALKRKRARPTVQHKARPGSHRYACTIALLFARKCVSLACKYRHVAAAKVLGGLTLVVSRGFTGTPPMDFLKHVALTSERCLLCNAKRDRGRFAKHVPSRFCSLAIACR